MLLGVPPAPPQTTLHSRADNNFIMAPVDESKKVAGKGRPKGSAMSKLESCWKPKPKRKGVKGAAYKGKPRGRKPKAGKK